ncbi:mannitol-1-phosphate 5-dehydrogenase [Escherichia coli]|uniref:Mannitol-1-phosphate 5-dehydrogenase n=1 Tax=Escherichia coli TaxID=562 RepID=A0A2A2C838_ECOLX|nr:mannitol-1-phosphate 5-dehydrogenase [Escherichia coli]PAU20349.1 mannitol-1-phosphate 5-dehydrogenase [Escherichia coli]
MSDASRGASDTMRRCLMRRLPRLIMPTGLNRRSDKALASHPTPCADA